MFRIYPLKDVQVEKFNSLFSLYYKELGCEDDIDHLLDEYVVPDYISGLLSIDLIDEDGETVGFIIYQTDSEANEWNFKQGWGDIREIYLLPAHRRKGLGRFLLYSAEMKLKERGAEKCYALPYEEACPFFTACGYSDSGEYSEELDCPVYVKTELNKTCECK